MRGLLRGACVVAPGGMRGCSGGGGMHGEGGHAWQRGGVCCKGGGVCMVKGGMRGKGGHVWQRGGMRGMHPSPRDMAGHCAGGTHPTGMHSSLY